MDIMANKTKEEKKACAIISFECVEYEFVNDRCSILAYLESTFNRVIHFVEPSTVTAIAGDIRPSPRRRPKMRCSVIASPPD